MRLVSCTDRAPMWSCEAQDAAKEATHLTAPGCGVADLKTTTLAVIQAYEAADGESGWRLVLRKFRRNVWTRVTVS